MTLNEQAARLEGWCSVCGLPFKNGDRITRDLTRHAHETTCISRLQSELNSARATIAAICERLEPLIPVVLASRGVEVES